MKFSAPVTDRFLRLCCVDSLFTNRGGLRIFFNRFGYPVVLLTALITRLPGLAFYRMVFGDQGRYLGMADQILKGRFQWSSIFPLFPPDGVFSNFIPPFYPVLTAFFGIFTGGNLRLSGVLISFICGIASIYVFMRCVEKMQGRCTALISGLFLALTPLFISLSTTCYVEMLYVLLMSWGCFSLIDSVMKKKMHHKGWILCGVVFALAALTRPEAKYLAIGLPLIISLKFKSFRPLWIVAVLFLFLVPMKIHRIITCPPELNINKLSWDFNEKGNRFDKERSLYSVDDEGNLEYIDYAKQSPIAIFKKNAARIPGIYLSQSEEFYTNARDKVLFRGCIFFGLLGIIGGCIFSRRRFIYQLLLLILLFPAVYLPLIDFKDRYFCFSMFIYMMFVALGISLLSRFLMYFFLRVIKKKHITGSIFLFFCGIFVILSVFHIRSVKVDSISILCAWTRTEIFAEYVGELIAEGGSVAAQDASFGYLSDKRQVPFPFGSEEQLFKYFKRKNTSYILIDSLYLKKFRPEQGAFLRQGSMKDYKLVLSHPGGQYFLYRFLPVKVTEELQEGAFPEENFIRLLEKRPPSDLNYYLKGIILYSQNKKKQALESFEKISIFSVPELYIDAQKQAYKLRIYLNSLVDEQKNARLLSMMDSSFPWSRFYRALKEEKKGNIEKASALFKKCLEDFPEDHILLEQFYQFCLRQDLEGQMEWGLKRWISIEQESHIPCILLAKLYRKTRKWDAHESLCRRKIPLFTETPELHFSLIRGYLNQEKTAEALKASEEICRFFPENEWGFYYQMFTLNKSGKVGEASVIYHKLLKRTKSKFLRNELKVFKEKHGNSIE